VNRRGVVVLAASLVLAVAVVTVVVVRSLPPDAAPPAGPGAAPPAGAATPRPSPTPFPPAGKVFLGLQTNAGPADFAPVDAFAGATKYRPRALQFSQGWAHDKFRPEAFNAIADRGMLPIVSWEPWDYTLPGQASSSGDQPAYRLAAIVNGTYDEYIRSWATGIAKLPYPVVMRFAHEMNGFWYPWCERANGNHPGEYVQAWRHVYDLFAQAHAGNVTWLWSPNVTYPGAQSLAELYPGDEYVDWIGLSGYYGTAGREAYIGFDDIFAATLTELATFTHRPVVITETGATNAAGQQARWITDMFSRLPRHPEVIGVIWFEATKEIDWRIAKAPDAAAAFAAGAADPAYDVTWAPNGVPRKD
jgi:mannan endo-1,4-beta-mannosidase